LWSGVGWQNEGYAAVAKCEEVRGYGRSAG